MGSGLTEMVNPEVVEAASELAERFQTARPFRHVAIDRFFTDDTARTLAHHFPAFDRKRALNEDGEVGAKAVNENVRALGRPWRELDALVQSEQFREFISGVTGVPNLQYDPHYFGGGTHENLHGQSLDAHVDFNFHPITRQHRRLNLIVYLTESWDDAWGGSIQLHKDPYLPPSEDEIVVVTPRFNRCVIFETNEHSWHGFPRINLPEDQRHISRKSFALYYYTDSRPADELGPEHSTIYVEQHLPEDLQPGVPLTEPQLQQLRGLVSSRDQHLRRLYGNIKQLNAELNSLKETFGVQAPPSVADEPRVGKGRPAGRQAGSAGSDAGDTSDPACPEGEATLDASVLAALLAQREARLRYLEARVREFETSTSWRITRPMRQLRRLFGGR